MEKPSVFLWKYWPSNRNYPGYHLTADNEGIDLIISKLSETQHPLKNKLSISIDLTIPTENEFSVPNCPGRPVPFSEWVIDLYLKSDLGLFQLSELDKSCRLKLGKSKIAELFKGLEDIRNGTGDYCIGGDDNELWFWWRVA